MMPTVLQINANTVLAAYRRLRSENLLESRRGRPVTPTIVAAFPAAVIIIGLVPAH